MATHHHHCCCHCLLLLLLLLLLVQICEEARIAVASALPPELVGSDSVTDSM
jgi:hypothetical protein